MPIRSTILTDAGSKGVLIFAAVCSKRALFTCIAWESSGRVTLASWVEETYEKEDTHAKDVLHHVIHGGLNGARGDAILRAQDEGALLPAVGELNEGVRLTSLLLLLGLHQLGEEGLATVFRGVHGVLVDDDHVGEAPVLLCGRPAKFSLPQLGLFGDRRWVLGHGALRDREEVRAKVLAHDRRALARLEEILPVLTDEEALEDSGEPDLSIIASLCLRILVPEETADSDQADVGARVHAKVLLEGDRAHEADCLGEVMIELIHTFTEGGDESCGSVLLDRVVVRGDDDVSCGSGGLGLAGLLPRPLGLLGRDPPGPHAAEICDELGELAELE